MCPKRVYLEAGQYSSGILLVSISSSTPCRQLLTCFPRFLNSGKLISYTSSGHLLPLIFSLFSNNLRCFFSISLQGSFFLVIFKSCTFFSVNLCQQKTIFSYLSILLRCVYYSLIELIFNFIIMNRKLNLMYQ